MLLFKKKKDKQETKKEAGADSFCGHICYLIPIVVFDKVIQIGHLARPQREEQCHDARGIYKQQQEQQQPLREEEEEQEEKEEMREEEKEEAAGEMKLLKRNWSAN